MTETTTPAARGRGETDDAFEFRVPPFQHQADTFRLTRNEREWAYFLEQGLGKSKLTIDVAAWLWSRGEIDAVLVFAPAGVHRAWVHGDATAGDDPCGHVGENLPTWVPYRVAYWSSRARKAERDAIEALFEPRRRNGIADPLRWLAINVEGIASRKVKGVLKPSRSLALARRYLHAFRCLLVVDESTCVKGENPRSETIIQLAGLAPYRRILSGEPAPEGPLDLYYQLNVLQDDPLGFGSYYSFRARYADLETKHYPHPKIPGKTLKVKQVAGWKNQDDLDRRLAKISTSLRKDDCLDLPERMYVTRPVEATEEQRRIYNQLLDEYLLEIRPNEELEPRVVKSALTRMLRCQQVLGGFGPDHEGNVIAVPGPNPKMDALVEETRGLLNRGRKVLVWSIFRAELAAIAERLRELTANDVVVEYHGGVTDADRDRAKARFQHDESCLVFVGNPKAGRYNLTLTACQDVVWYSWGWPLEDYIQANDRVHRIGTTGMVRYLHLLIEGTVEARNLGALRGKQELTKSIRTSTDLRALIERAKL